MKLHLPSGLRKALLACLAALAMPAFTVSSGAALFGGVAFSILAGQQLMAQELSDALAISDDEDDETDASLLPGNGGIMPIASDWQADVAWGDAATVWEANGSDNSMSLSGNVMWVDISAENENNLMKFSPADAESVVENLRLTMNGPKENGNMNVGLGGVLSAHNIWFEGTDARARIDTATLLNKDLLQNIRVSGVQLWFTGEGVSYTGENKLAANISLGSTSYAENNDGLDFACLRMGISVETSGNLHIQAPGVDENIARIGFQGGANLSFDGAISGEGGLILSAFSTSESYLALGEGGELDGVLEIRSTISLRLGEGAVLTLNGLKMSGNEKQSVSVIDQDGSKTATIWIKDIVGESEYELTAVGGGSFRFADGVGLKTTGGLISFAATTTSIGGTVDLSGLKVLGAESVPNSGNVHLKKGGIIRGDLVVAWGGHLHLGGDLEVTGSIGISTTPEAVGCTISKESGVDGPVFIILNFEDVSSLGTAEGIAAAFAHAPLAYEGVGFGISTEQDLELSGGANMAGILLRGSGENTLTLAGDEAYEFSEGLAVSQASLSVNAALTSANTVLRDGSDMELNAAAGGSLGHLSTELVELESAESTITATAGTWTATGISIAAGTTLILDGSHNAGTLKVGTPGEGEAWNAGTIRLDGTLVLKGYNAGSGNNTEWTLLGKNPNVNIEAGDDARIVLDFSGAGDRDDRTKVEALIGSSYTGVLELKNYMFSMQVGAETGASNTYSEIFVHGDTQLQLDGAENAQYSGTIHISGLGYLRNTGQGWGQAGALRLDQWQHHARGLTGHLILDDDASINNHNDANNNTGVILSGEVSGNEHILYKYGAGKLILSGQITDLAGLWTKNAGTNGCGDGGDIEISGDLGIVALAEGYNATANYYQGADLEANEGSFVFGVTGSSNNITLTADSTLTGTDVNIRKVGAGTLNLNGHMAGFSGSLEITAGSVELNNHADDGEQIVFSEVTLSGGTLKLGGRTGGVFIGGLSGTSGSVSAAAACTLTINTDAGAAYTTSATLNATANDAALITLTKKGAGKQTISGAVALAALNMQSGSLALLGGGSTGLVTFSNGQLSLQMAGSAGLTAAGLASGNNRSNSFSITLGDDSAAGQFTLDVSGDNNGEGNTGNADATDVTFGADGALVNLVKQGAGSQVLRRSTIHGNVSVTAGVLRFDGATTVTGTLTVADTAGHLIIFGDTNDGDNNVVKLYQGGTVSQDLYMGWSANLALGADLLVQGLVGRENAVSVSALADDDGEITDVTLQVNASADKSFNGPLTINSHVILEKTGAARQTFNTLNVKGKALVSGGAMQVGTLNLQTWDDGLGGGVVQVVGSAGATPDAAPAVSTLTITNALSVADKTSLILSEHSSFSAPSLTIQSGGSLIMDGGSFDPSSNFTLNEGGVVKIVRGKTWTVSALLPWTVTTSNLQAVNPIGGGTSTALATLEWTYASGDTSVPGYTFGEGLRFRYNIESSWGTFSNLTILEELELAHGELCIDGQSSFARVTAGENGSGRLTVLSGAAVTIGGDSDINAQLDVRAYNATDSTTVHLLGDLSIKGLTDYGQNSGTLTIDSIGADGSVTDGADLTIAFDTTDAASYSFNGDIDISGQLMKSGSGSQTIGKSVSAGDGILMNGGSLIIQGNVTGDLQVTAGNMTIGKENVASTLTGSLILEGGTFTWAGTGLTVTEDLTVNGGSVFEQTTFDGIENTTAGAKNVLRIKTGLTVQGGLNFLALSESDSEYSSIIQIDGNFSLGMTSSEEARKGIMLGSDVTLLLSGTTGQTQTITGSMSGDSRLYVRGTGSGTAPTLTVDLQRGGTLSKTLIAGMATLKLGDTFSVGGLRAVSMGESFSRRDLAINKSEAFIGEGDVDFILNVVTKEGDGDATVFRGDLTLGEGVRLVKDGAANQVIGGSADGGLESNAAGATTLTAHDIWVKQGILQVSGAANILGNISIEQGATMRFWKTPDGERVVHGAVTGAGNLATINKTLHLLSGGNISGNLTVGWNDTEVALGNNLEVGSLHWIGNNSSKVSKFSKTTKTPDSGSIPDVVTLKVNGTDSEANNSGRYATTSDVKLVLANSAALKVNSSSFDGEVNLQGSSSLIHTDGDSSISGALNATANNTLSLNGGTLTLSAATAATANESFGGTLAFAGGALALNRDLTVSNLTATNNAANALSGTGSLTIDVGSADTSSTGGQLSVADVELVKEGSGSYEFAGLTTTGKVTINEGSLILQSSSVGDTLAIAGATTAVFKGTSSLSGDLQGSGDMILDAATLTVSGTGSPADGYTGRISLRSGSTLTLSRDVSVGGLSDLEAATITGSQNITGNGSLILNVGTGKTESSKAQIAVGTGVTLVKSGAGTQELRDLSANAVTVSDGVLRLLGDNGRTIFRNTISNLVVDAATLEVQCHNWESADTHVTLSNGATFVAEPTPQLQTGQSARLNLGTLKLSGSAANYFKWSVDGTHAGDSTLGQQHVVFDQLTGSGSLVVDDFGHGALDSSSRRRRLLFNEVNSFNGSLSAENVVGPYSRIAIGHVHQGTNDAGIFNVGGGVYTNDFRKTGLGKVTINQLNAIVYNNLGDLYMDYEGEMQGLNGAAVKLTVAEGVTLCYTRGSESHQLRWDVAELEAMRSGVFVDVSRVMNSAGGTETLRSGICLGITGVSGYTEEQLNELMDKLTLSDADSDTMWRLETRNDLLWLVVDDFSVGESEWDAHWIEGNGLRNAPNEDAMANAVLHADDLNRAKGDVGYFADHVIELSADNNAGSYERPGQRLTLLTAGDDSPDTKAVVLGGVLQGESNMELVQTELSTYIMLRPEEGAANEAVRYHALVGGSSCVSVWDAAEDDSNMGGFTGQTHIQMEGGTVDYIVGGNHVTNRAFSFEGSSFISVMGGDVRGGIVGGSTLTMGSTKAQVDVTEYSGIGSYIFIYTALHNGETTPDLDTGAGMADNAFTAVVGGNAWIGLPTARGGAIADMAPTFAANSHITIDLAEAAGAKLSFEKDIVGGNYTVFTNTGATSGATNRSSVFEGNAYVTISIGSRADEDAVFTGSIVGASRRASGGDGYTEFYGDTYVTINGGTFEKAIVGGMRFDSTATGNHSARLEGDTNVTVNGGHIWRVVGGSYSLAGGEGGSGLDGKPECDGNSYVSITGGVFDSAYGSTSAEGQQGRGFVAGGDFYRNTKGSNHERVGDTHVSISGGSFHNLHIVGGDYANMTGVAEGQGVAISGTSNVLIDGAAVSITGLVVGGSYLTDESGQGGYVSVQHTDVTINSGSLVAESADSDHDHKGIAVVAGHVIIDEAGDNGTGGHSATVTGDTHVTINGGSITGHIVGGSYANETEGVNSLQSSGTHFLALKGGSITGNIYGGHYSENTVSPDTLALNDVTITLDGATVTGDIVGGNYRSALAAAATAPTQGDITVELLSGVLTGSVYAAGQHTGKEAPLAVSTNSTTVVVGAGVALTAGETISGGYRKVSAQDASSVSSALLRFCDAGYTNLDGVSWTSFDTVDAASAVTLVGSFRTSVDKDSFTKIGAGMLTLSQGLQNASGSAFGGLIQVNDGILALGSQQKLSNIAFDLSTRMGRNSQETAYLQAVGDGALTLPGSGLVSVEVTYAGEKALNAGTYYLTGELSGIGNKTVEELFAFDQDAIAGLITSSKLKAELLIDTNHCLVLRVHNDSPDEWYWTGESEDTQGNFVWNNDSVLNWTREAGNTLQADHDLSPERADVHFNAGAVTTNVYIQGAVTPNNVFVESGSYIFSGSGEASAEGMKMYSGARLVVGTENVNNPADLTLALDNKNIPTVALEMSGTLYLASTYAINGGDGTEIEFNGGKLVYSEAEGALLFTQDMSRQVVDSTGVIRLQIGNSTEDTPVEALAPAAPAAEIANNALSVVWGSSTETLAANRGVNHALTMGIEKSGRGDLSLAWLQNEEIVLSGSIEVQDGLLALEVNTAENVTLQGDAVQLAASGVVQFAVSGVGRMIIDRAFEGAGTAVIGSEATGNYRMLKSNAGFAGTISLLGSSSVSGSRVSVYDIEALGGAGTTLQLAGRHFRLVATGTSEVVAGTIDVAEGSVNYVGDVEFESEENVNASITLTGSVVGSGVMANALGGFNHMLTGDVSGFTGTLVAGAQGIGTAGVSDSVWTLSGDEAPAQIQANLAGTGRIDIAYAEAAGKQIVLSGSVGDEKLGKNTSLRNKSVGSTLVLVGGENNLSEGELSFAGGDFQIGLSKDEVGSWAGSFALAGGVTSGVLKLVSGSVSKISESGDIAIVADVARGAEMKVSGTDGREFSEITVNEGGLLSGVSGVINASAMSVTGTTKVRLVLGAENVSNTPGGKGLISMETGGQLIVSDAAGLDIEFSNAGLLDVLVNMREDASHDNRAYLHLLNSGSLAFADSMEEDELQLIFGDGNAKLLKDLGFRLDRAPLSSGDMALIGSSKDVYLVVGSDDAPDARSDERYVTDWHQFDDFKATVVDENASLTIEMSEHNAVTDAATGELVNDDRITVRNLVGLEGSTLEGKNSLGTGEVITIVLDNTSIADLDKLDGTGIESVGDGSLTKDSLGGQDTTFSGTLKGDAFVNFEKTGKGTLTVGSESGSGGLGIAGELAISEGALEVLGHRGEAGNVVGTLSFAYESEAADGEKRGLTLSGGTTAVRGIVEATGYTDDNIVRLENEGELSLKNADDTTLTGACFESADGSGTLTVDNSRLTLDSQDQAAERLSNVNVSVVNDGTFTLAGGSQMKDGSLSVEHGAAYVTGSSVTGKTGVILGEDGRLFLTEASVLDTSEAVEIGSGASLSVDESSKLVATGGVRVDGELELSLSSGNEITGLTGSGTLRGWVPADADDDGKAELTIYGSAEQNAFSGSFDGAGKLTIAEGSGLTLVSVSRGSSRGAWDLLNMGDLVVDLRNNASSSLGDVHLGASSVTRIMIDTDEGYERMGKLDMANFTWDSGAQLMLENTGNKALTDSSIDMGSLSGHMTEGGIQITLVGLSFAHYETGDLYQENGRWMLNLVEKKDNQFITSGMEKNALAGGNMLWEASKSSSANWRRITDGDTTKSDLYKLVSAVWDMAESEEGRSSAELSRTLAAAAGASTSVLGAAMAQDLERQLHAVRNRTTSLQSRDKNYNLWLNGEGAYHKLESDGLAPGYTLSNWGGTVGMDLSVNDNLTMGLALSAMYGDLKTDSADHGRGDMDTTYATIFARLSSGAWMHTFLFSGGVADVSMNRTVSYGTGAYTTKGSTDGFAIGALYELGYTSKVNAEGTSLVQTVFNVEVRHASVDGYKETGTATDAGLNVGSAEYTAVTLGAGARMQSVFDPNALNRSILFEGRALVKVDLGDRSGKVRNDLINGNNAAQALESARIGALGIELGAGISCPVGQHGSMFFDASVECRAGYTSLDANVGYRVSF